MRLRVNYKPFEKKRTPGGTTSRTKQQFMKECDIHEILRKASKGQLPDLISRDPRYGDFTSALEYQEACNVAIKAQEQFNALDARVRERFLNDPVNFLKFASDASNMEEMVKLGMAIRKPVQSQPDVNPKDMGGGSPPKKAPLPKKGAKEEVTE